MVPPRGTQGLPAISTSRFARTAGDVPGYGPEPDGRGAGPGLRFPLITSYGVKEAKRKQSARILVADDHTVNQQLAVLMLERFGHRPDVVANGKEAVEAVTRKPYDLVLMDCQMPEMDGYTATRTIRKWETSYQDCPEAKGSNQVTLHPAGAASRIPIIAMTANALQGDEKVFASRHGRLPVETHQARAVLRNVGPVAIRRTHKRRSP